ncbi:hypothetical protein ASG11_00040 [Sphingomonas sp. Leaf357]|uniref:DUF1345 domain-containing protein n=1 Tax=Sphingomonas sp. Leaf357 TaxID=1736350 RepID=UPI0006F30172|nr:DUF1345 domain-containing protein [Sphingomonas sp. Leaf357]KQS02859.1 hypothetical protein ASG11_00040 [Sphingomonas sp. Leaf357]
MKLNLGHRIAPTRFVVFVILFGTGLGVLIPMLGRGRGAMAAFDIAALVFLAAVVPLLSKRAADMRAIAKSNDANRALLLAVTAIVMGMILVSVASEMMGGKSTKLGIALIVATLVLAWLFSNTIYALHYAHIFYLGDGQGQDRGGIDVPGCDEPDYWDFVYFSFTLGMTFQTSDVEITSPKIRRVVTGHCLAAFVFNIGVLAFTINVLGGGG